MSLSVELKQPLPLNRHEEATNLLRGRHLTQDLDDALEDGGVGFLTDLLPDPPVTLHVEGGQYRLLLRVALELLLNAPIRLLLRELSIRAR
jgi:hypothetical protein